LGHSDKDNEIPDLTTPTIKSDIFTTGRGGQGNMAKNDPRHPEFAREAQDVEGRPPRPSNEAFHTGRGGGGNVGKPTDAEIIAAKQEQLRWEMSHPDKDPVDHTQIDYRGWADKGKDMLFGRKK